MSKTNKGLWEIRYSGDFGRSLYGRYADYNVAKAELDLFIKRCRKHDNSKVALTAELVKT